MVKKILIYSDNEKTSLILREVFYENIFDIREFTLKDFMMSDECDIINLPTTFMQDFGAIPQMLDCQIIETNGLYNFPSYVATSPNFITLHDLNYDVMNIFQIQSPLKKVIEFSKGNKLDLIYGVFAEFIFAYTTISKESLILAKEYIMEVIQK